MATRRQRKVSELLHEELSQIVLYQSQDPRLALVTVTGVNVTADLQIATVYFTVLGDETDQKEAFAALEKASGFLRYKLSQAVSLRHMPELIFKVDHSLENALRIENLLEQIKDSDPPSEIDE